MMLPNLTDERTQTVLPMNDSLYGAAHVELDRLGPVVIGVPRGLPDGRYWSIALLDAFMNNFAHLGPKWTGGTAPASTCSSGPAGTGRRRRGRPASCGRRRSRSCSITACWSATSPATSTPSGRWRRGLHAHDARASATGGETPPAIETADLVHGDLRSLDDPLEFLRLGFAHLERNPPPVEDRWLIELLRGDAVPRAERRRPAPGGRRRRPRRAADPRRRDQRRRQRRDGWTVPFAHTAEQGPYVLEQAVTQLRAIGVQRPRRGDLPVRRPRRRRRPARRLRRRGLRAALRGDDLPPLDEPGFWSLTMYRPPTACWSPTRSAATRPGSARPGFVSATTARRRSSWPRRLPDGVPEANWLPAPADEPFQVGLRLYYPTEAIRDGAWFPPPIRKISDQP